MSKYGIDKVRGGNYSSEKLSKYAKNFIRNEINHAKNCCFICKKNGHISSNC